MTPVLRVGIGDRVTLRKAHPCGSFEWEVTRTGTDIGMKCLKCGRRVLLPREEFERRVRRLQGSGGEEDSP